MHILSPETDNCPSWISGRERMTLENISWSISTKECCRLRRGWNPRPPGLQSDAHPTEPPRPAIHRAITCDSFTVLAKKSLRGVGWQSKKKDLKAYFSTSSDPRHVPGATFLHHCILLFITLCLICKMTRFVQNGFWPIGATLLALSPGVTSKFRMCSSSPHPQGYYLWQFKGSS